MNQEAILHLLRSELGERLELVEGGFRCKGLKARKSCQESLESGNKAGTDGNQCDLHCVDSCRFSVNSTFARQRTQRESACGYWFAVSKELVDSKKYAD